MRHFKALLLTLFAILLTGCYTQLQYSKTTQKSNDEQEENVSGYSWTDDDNNGETAEAYKEKGENIKTRQSLEDDYRSTYKYYEYLQKWEECECNPYNFYGLSFNDYGYYPYGWQQPYLTTSPFYNSWRFGSFYSPRYYYGSRFSLGFSWRYPYHSYFYNRFYGYGYSGFWGYHNHDAYSNSYGSSIYYGSNSQDVSKNNRYGRRSIGTDRVNVNRSRGSNNGTVRGLQKSIVTSGGTTVRTRSSVGTSRTRNRGTVRNSSSSENNSRGTVRSRDDRGNDNRSSQRIRNRSVSDNDLDNIATQQQSRTFQKVTVEVRENDRRTLLNRFKEFLKRNSQTLTTGSRSNSTFGSSIRSSFGSSSAATTRSRSTVGSSTSNRSSVGSSQSSSSSSRSRGSSSRSRSGGNDGGGSSSSDRSRDN
ncbi:hypothetical protein LX73_0862 [Fodinibius salinus]|uniref:Vitellogenin II n=1 Tax=Fodinibius salinus TaxID=860790 RepID=A0A5D3YNV6_9BACT|nr:DUF3300 domain-containing protein [Fodinibius salinus]TYP95554.1 hypothetical protein LX73_0862 [Fodinibius salinus]